MPRIIINSSLKSFNTNKYSFKSDFNTLNIKSVKKFLKFKKIKLKIISIMKFSIIIIKKHFYNSFISWFRADQAGKKGYGEGELTDPDPEVRQTKGSKEELGLYLNQAEMG